MGNAVDRQSEKEVEWSKCLCPAMESDCHSVFRLVDGAGSFRIGTDSVLLPISGRTLG